MCHQVIVDSLGFAGACRWVLRDIGAAAPPKRGGTGGARGGGGGGDDRASPSTLLAAGASFNVARARVESCRTAPPRFLQVGERRRRVA